MSLQVWLPLNGSLDNQGLDTRQISQVGTGISLVNGKIGKCFQFPNDCASYIHMPGFNLQTGSWAVWIKVLGEGAKSRQCLMSQGRDSYSDGVEIYTSQNGTTLSFKAHKITLSTSIELNKWYHIVGTFGNNLIKLYIDGVLTKSGNYTEDMTYEYSNNRFVLGKMSFGYTNTSNYFPFNGCLNDVRIYDHVLSAQEIKRLSKGLMLHYPLSKNGWGQDNLIRGTKNWNLWSRGSGTTYSGDVVTLAGTTADWSAMLASAHFDKSLLDGTTLYTWSFEYKCNADAAIYSYISGTTTGIDVASAQRTKFGNWKNTTLPSTNGEWKHYVLSTRTFSESQMTSGSGDVTCCYIQFYIRTDNVSVDFRRIKFEKGDIATPWSPNPVDSITSLTDFNSNIEYDVSGFNNNGTRMGTINWTSDTPRHRVSTLFNGTNSFISRSTVLEGEPLTVSVWVKTLANKSTSQIVFYDSGSELGVSFYQGCIIGLIGNSTASTGSKCTLGSSYIENGWNHIVVVKTGTGTRDIYCNRVKLTATSNDRWTSFATGVKVGTRETSSPLYFNGQLSDLRVYATAFTQTDVDNLYNGGGGI